MSNILQIRYKRLFLLFIFLLFIVYVVLLFRDLFIPKYYDTESMLHFISEPKNIKPKDFYDIIKQLMPKPQEENKITTQNQNISQLDEKQENTPLILHAIINQNALINTTWLKPNESFTNNNNVYILQKITKYGVYLKHKDNHDDVIYLEIFTPPDELLLQIH